MAVTVALVGVMEVMEVVKVLVGEEEVRAVRWGKVVDVGVEAATEV